MAKVKNPNYFKSQGVTSEKGTASAADIKTEDNISNEAKENAIPRHVNLSASLLEAVKNAATSLKEVGFPGLANDMARLHNLAVNKNFTVAFVGEFNKGKSTLINKLLGENILPSSILPTTAILTRIVYSPTPRLTVLGKDGKKIKELPLEQKSWEGLTAANFGEKEPEGSVVVECNDEWLFNYGITLLDTPGAGDLEEKRAQVIERCMVNADGAIITLDATKPLSMTEQAFINQKVKSRGVPFMAVALTKLDLVNEDERKGVISYLLKRLEALKITMPIVIPDDSLPIPGLEDFKEHKILVGVDKLRGLMVAWMANENRRALMERWLSVNALALLNAAKGFLLQQKEIIDAKDLEKEKLIRKRSNALSEVHSNWNELRKEMDYRCQKCYDAFLKSAEEAGDSIVEALQHEVDRQPNPKEWLEKEYAYRVKRELTALSLSLDNLVAKHVTTDMRWLNGELSKQFKEIVGTDVEALMSKEDFRPDVDDQAIRLDNLKDKSVKATVVSSVLTLGAALLLGVTGGAPLILATMGVGTGANILSRKMLEKAGNRQREALKDLIAQQIPTVIKNATHDSLTKIKIIYNDIISESHDTEARWMTAQRNLIRASIENSTNDHGNPKEEIVKRIDTVDSMISIFNQPV